MWRLVKYELLYHFGFMIFIVILPVIYTCVVFGVMELLSQNDVVSRVIYPVLAGAAPTVLIGIAWINSKKEKREYLHHKLCVTRKQIVLAKIIFVVIPLGFLLVYNFMINYLFIDEWHYITKRVIYQIGIISLILSNLLIASEILEREINWRDGQKIFVGGIYFAFFLLLLFISDNILFPVINQAYIGILYTFVGFGLFLIGIKIYSERKIFTF